MKNLCRKETWVLVVLVLNCMSSAFGGLSNETGGHQGSNRSLIQVLECTGDITLSTQAEVDAYPSVHGCAQITGSLTISGADITNIESLSSLLEVNGHLNITSNPRLARLQGLNNLVSIAGNLYISNNDLLTNLHGLESITRLVGTSFDASLNIIGNELLTNIDALSALTTIRSGSELSGGGYLRITNNPVLANVNGLRSLTQISGMLFCGLNISNNDSLLDLDGLAALDTLAGFNLSFGLNDNASLNNVNGLSSLTLFSQRPHVTVVNNPSLLQCCGLYTIVNHAHQVPGGFQGGTVEISGNGAACTEEDILAGGPCSSSECNGNVTLSTQAEVDAFPSVLRCTQITGSLTISGADITNIESLSSLLEVKGSLDISSNPRLVSLQGLNLVSKAGSLFINNNDLLPNLNGMESLTQLVGALGSISLHISGNESLTNIDALSALTSIRSGSGSPASAAASLSITNNPVLAHVNGLQSLARIVASQSTRLEISNNDSLLDLDGLAALDTLQGLNLFVIIRDNASLTNVNGLSSLTVVSQRPSIDVTNNPSLIQCCGLYKIVAHAYQTPGGSTGVGVAVSGNGATCTEEDILANGPCCNGGTFPQDKYVTAEYHSGYAPHSTNIIVMNFEPGILYELRKNADDSHVAGPFPGNIGLFAGGVTETTEYNVLARNPETGCERELSVNPIITILTLRDSTECVLVHFLEKDLVAEFDTLSVGGATNILVLNGDAGVEYLLRSNADNREVAGPYPSSVGLYSGALYETTTFNVVAIDLETNCRQQLSELVTVTVVNDPAPFYSDNSLLVYPNPGNGEFDVELKSNSPETDYVTVIVTDLLGAQLTRQTLVNQNQLLKGHVDMKPIKDGLYLLTIQNSNGARLTRRIVIRGY